MNKNYLNIEFVLKLYRLVFKKMIRLVKYNSRNNIFNFSTHIIPKKNR